MPQKSRTYGFWKPVGTDAYDIYPLAMMYGTIGDEHMSFIYEQVTYTNVLPKIMQLIRDEMSTTIYNEMFVNSPGNNVAVNNAKTNIADNNAAFESSVNESCYSGFIQLGTNNVFTFPYLDPEDATNLTFHHEVHNAFFFAINELIKCLTTLVVETPKPDSSPEVQPVPSTYSIKSSGKRRVIVGGKYVDRPLGGLLSISGN